MLILPLIAICFIQSALAQYGEQPEYPKSNVDLSGYPQELPYSVPYYQETINYDPGYSSSSSSSSEEDHCHDKKVKHAHCPKRLRSDGGRCTAPHTRRFELNDKEFLEVTCKAEDEWTALVTSSGKIITVTKGKLEHVLACSRRDHKWKTFTFSGERIYLKHVFCVQGDIVDKFLNRTESSTSDPSGDCNSCSPITVTDQDNGVASAPVNSTYTSRNGKVCLKQTITCTAPSTQEKAKFKINYHQRPSEWTDRSCLASINIYCDEHGHWKHDFKPVDELKCDGAGDAGTCPALTTTTGVTTTGTTPTTTRPTTTTATTTVRTTTPLACTTCAYPSTSGDSITPSYGTATDNCKTLTATCPSNSNKKSEIKVYVNNAGPAVDKKCNANLQLKCFFDRNYYIYTQSQWRRVTRMECDHRTSEWGDC